MRGGPKSDILILSFVGRISCRGVRRYIFVCVACNYRMLDDNGDVLLELYLLGAYRCMDSWYYVTVGDIVRRWSSSLMRSQSQSQVDRYKDTQSDSRFFRGSLIFGVVRFNESE